MNLGVINFYVDEYLDMLDIVDIVFEVMVTHNAGTVKLFEI
jgi:hypothetical protein